MISSSAAAERAFSILKRYFLNGQRSCSGGLPNALLYVANQSVQRPSVTTLVYHSGTVITCDVPGRSFEKIYMRVFGILRAIFSRSIGYSVI